MGNSLMVEIVPASHSCHWLSLVNGISTDARLSLSSRIVIALHFLQTILFPEVERESMLLHEGQRYRSLWRPSALLVQRKS